MYKENMNRGREQGETKFNDSTENLLAFTKRKLHLLFWSNGDYPHSLRHSIH